MTKQRVPQKPESEQVTPPRRELTTVDGIAAMAAISRGGAYRYLVPRLRSYRIGKSTRYDVAEAQALIDSMAEEPAQGAE